MNDILSGTYKGNTYRIKVECYPNTPAIKVQLLPVNAPIIFRLDNFLSTCDLIRNLCNFLSCRLIIDQKLDIICLFA